MAYDTNNPPGVAVLPLIGGTQSSTQPSGPVVQRSGQTWLYASVDPSADVDAVGYFTNGKALGMRVGDVVQVHETDTGAVTMHRVITVNATTGAVTVSTTGTPIV